MNDLNATSSDLKRSQELSRRLARRRQAEAVQATNETGAAYAVFSAERFLTPVVVPRPLPEPVEAAAPAPEPVEAAAPLPEPEPHYTVDIDGFDTWERLLSWCADAVHASGAFVVGQDGFVIANYGREPELGFEGLGANLSAAVHHMDRCGEDSLAWFDMGFDASWMVGVQWTTAEGNAFVFALRCSEPAPRAARKAISRQIQYSMRHLD